MTEVAAAEHSLRVAIVYNPFRSNEIERHDLPFTEGATIADYMGDLGDSAWTVGYKGEAYEQGQWSDIVPEAGEGISLVRVPEGGGGGGGKDILRMVAMLAVMVVAMHFVGPWAAAFFAEGSLMATAASAVAMASFTAAGMMVVNAVLPPAEMTEKVSDGQSYGVDGPKNTSREGVVVPIGFGEYRLGGNITDMFNKNVGDDQYLYIRTVLNDGRVDSIYDIEINDQPISTFTDVQTRIALGDEEGAENDWFGEAVRMFNKGLELETSWLTQTTATDVDRLRFDLLYPGGLGYHKDDGRVLAAESDVAFEYRPAGSTGAFMPLGGMRTHRFVGYNGGVAPMPGQGGNPPVLTGGTPLGMVLNAMLFRRNAQNEVEPVEGTEFGSSSPPTPYTGPNPVSGGTSDGLTFTTPANALRATVKALAVTGYNEGDAFARYDVSVCYREVGTPTWIVAGQEVGSVERTGGGEFPLVYRSYAITLDPAKSYEVIAFGGTVVEGVADLAAGGDGIVSLYRSKDEAFRYTYESGLLPRGKYEYRVRRVRPKEEGNKKRVDDVYLADVGEIDVDNIHYVGTANLSLRIKLGEQLNNVSKVTAMVKGSVVKQFDEDGNVTQEAWSPYPCWHVADILLNQDRGRGINPARIDYAALKEWEAHCIANGLEFNGVFDQESNVWDAMQVVCRAGHAQLVRIGTRYSFVIDKASEAVQVFNDSSIIEGSFTTTWLPLTERANEIHYTFYPKEEDFKETMIRAIDPDAQNSGAGLKVAAITEIGVTNYAQARFNIEKQLRENKLLKKTISFDAPLEAISVSLGDVAYVQHSSANYSKGIGTGRLKAGSSATVLNLDCPVKMIEGAVYRVLLVQSAVKRYTATVESIVGNNIFVSGLPEEVDRCLRLTQNGKDTAIRNIVGANPHDRISVDNASGFALGPVELWDTDVIEERTVVWQDETETLTVTNPLLVAPEAHAIWIVGPVETVKKKYRVTGIDGEGLHKRSLTFIDYDDRIYQPLNLPIVPSTPGQSPLPEHVKRLSLTYPPILDGGQTRVKAMVKWEIEDSRYGGADIYVAINGRPFSYLRSLQNVTSFEMDVALGDDIQIKVNAFNMNGRRAPADTAPVIGKVVSADAGELFAPTNVLASTGYFKVDAAVTVTWTASSSPHARDYRVEWLRITEAQYLNAAYEPAVDAQWNPGGVTQDTRLDIPRQDVGHLMFRVRAEYGRSVSPWTTYKFNLVAPELPDRVTGLRLNNGVTDLLTDTFTGKDARFEWRDVATEAALLAAEGADIAAMDWHWKDYEVTIKSLTGEVLRRQTTRDPFFTYTYEKNVEDTLAAGADGQRARRAFRIEVRLRGRQEQLSEPAIMEVSNPAPSLLPATPRAGINQLQLEIPDSIDPDYHGVIVWSSTAPGFIPGPANQRWMGPGQPTWFAAPILDHFVRYAIYDAFGTDELNVSDEITIRTTGLTDDMITPEAREGFTLSQELLNEIALVSSTGPGSVNDRIATEANARAAALATEQEERVNAIAAEASARATALQNQASTLGGQIATVNTRVTTVTDDLQQQIDMLEAASGDGYAGVVEERNQRVAADEAISSEITTIYSRLGSADAAIVAEASARATAVQSVTNTLNAQISRIDANASAITQEASTRTTAVNSLTTLINTLTSRVGNAESAITQEATTRAQEDDAMAAEFTTITASINANTAAITAEANTRATDVSAVSTRLDTVQANTNGNTAAIAAETTARTNAVTAVTNALNVQISRIDSNVSAISAETTTRASQTSALTTSINTLTSTVNGNYSANVNAINALTTNLNTEVTRINGLVSDYNGINSRLTTEETTRADQYGSLSSQITTLGTTVGGHTSTISAHTTSLNGLYAGWGIRINNNGAISGIGITSQIINGTAVSKFKVEADSVEFVPTGGGSGISPFIYDAANGRIIAQSMVLRGQLEVQSAAGGQRTVMNNSGMLVYDANNVLRVRLGVW